jgi:hypothetical protein
MISKPIKKAIRNEWMNRGWRGVLGAKSLTSEFGGQPNSVLAATLLVA